MWSGVIAPLSQTIRNKTKNNRDLFAHVFPRKLKTIERTLWEFVKGNRLVGVTFNVKRGEFSRSLAAVPLKEGDRLIWGRSIQV